MRVTQATIAKALGLSPSTVGLVTGACQSNATKKLKPETIQRIRAKAAELGYRSDRAAQVMRRGRSNLIGVVHSSGMTQTAVERAYHFGRMLHEGGYQLMVAEGLWYQGNVQEVVDQMLSSRVEGVLFSGPPQLRDFKTCFQTLQRLQIPTLLVGYAAEMPIPGVQADVRQGMRDLTRHLLSLGHRRLLLHVFSTGGANLTQSARELGFLDALAEFGIAKSDTLPLDQLPLAAKRWKKEDVWGHVVLNQGTRSPFNLFEPGERGMRALLETGLLPDALLCANDYWAIGAMTVCQRAGIRVPEQLAITGFDDTSLACQGPVGLTSVRQPIEAMCRKGVDLLLGMMRAGTITLPPGHPDLTLPCQTVVRESCGSATRNLAFPLPLPT